MAGFPNRRTTHIDLPTSQEPPYLTHEQDSSSSQQGGINATGDAAEDGSAENGTQNGNEQPIPLQIESLETVIADRKSVV